MVRDPTLEEKVGTAAKRGALQVLREEASVPKLGKDERVKERNARKAANHRRRVEQLRPTGAIAQSFISSMACLENMAYDTANKAVGGGVHS